MAISVHTLFKERKYPFVFVLTVLLFCALILLFSNSSQYPLSLYFDLQKHPLPIASPSSAHPPSDQVAPPPEKNQSHDGDAAAVDSRDNGWELCEGPMAVDYIPCLDNWLAIKALPSRRHMEHRERHCPDSSPRCLVPLPTGYKVPVPWPKSRDMVRLVLRFGMTMLLIQGSLTTRRIKIGFKSLEIILFFLVVVLSSRMELVIISS